jgi:predicted dinucleotide-binding enzyme
VVKAFNIVGHTRIIHPNFNGTKPDMLICGNHNAG